MKFNVTALISGAFLQEQRDSVQTPLTSEHQALLEVPSASSSRSSGFHMDTCRQQMAYRRQLPLGYTKNKG